MPENPHDYDDIAYQRASNQLRDAVWSLWESGASVEDIKAELDNAIENLDE